MSGAVVSVNENEIMKRTIFECTYLFDQQKMFWSLMYQDLIRFDSKKAASSESVELVDDASK